MRWVLLLTYLGQVAFAAKILSQNGTIYKILEKSSLELSCKVQDLNDDVAVAFYQGENLLTLDEERLTNDPRYNVVKEGNTYILSINGAEPIDSGMFYCSITDPEERIGYKIVVNSIPTVVLSPEVPILHTKVGEQNVVVKCYTKGNPKPTVSWERQDDKTPPGVIVRGSSLIITRIDKHHSGKYACNAQNEAGTASGVIEIRVNDANATEEKPWVKHSYNDGFIPAKKGTDAEVVCTYNGSPDPQLEWIFNGYKINFQEERFRNVGQTFQREKGFTKATLLLTNINEDMFGDYQCRASNQLGSDQVAVHVSGRPGPPKLALDEGILSWDVRSYDEIIEYRVHLRLQKQDEWTRHQDFRVSKNDKKGNDLWSREVNLREYIEPGVKYEVQVKARNGLGWGSFAKDYITIEIPVDEKLNASSGAIYFLVTVFGSIIFYLL